MWCLVCNKTKQSKRYELNSFCHRQKRLTILIWSNWLHSDFLRLNQNLKSAPEWIASVNGCKKNVFFEKNCLMVFWFGSRVKNIQTIRAKNSSRWNRESFNKEKNVTKKCCQLFCSVKWNWFKWDDISVKRFLNNKQYERNGTMLLEHYLS